MSHSSNSRRRRGHLGTAVVSLVTTLGATLVLGGPSAHADPASAPVVPMAAVGTDRAPAADYTLGEVVSDRPVSVSTGDPGSLNVCAWVRPGESVRVKYKVLGQNVDGNRVWYRLDITEDCGWISARYVKALGPVPWGG